MKSLLSIVTVLLFVATACGGTTREDAVDALVDAGFEASTADCVVTDVEAAGFEPSDLEGDTLEPDVEAAVQAGVEKCLTADDISGVVGDEDLRQTMIDSMTSTGAVTEAQATCAMDSLEGQGIDAAALTEAEINGDSGPTEALTQALVDCLAEG